MRRWPGAALPACVENGSVCFLVRAWIDMARKLQNFQPQRFRQQIEQYNLKHGDTPKNPPVDKFTPVTPNFALQQRAMIASPADSNTAPSDQDVTSQPILFKAMTIATDAPSS